MIYIVAVIEVKPEHRDAFIAGAKVAIESTLKHEEGCISYECLASVTDPARFVFVERWKSQEAIEAHGQMPHFKAWREYSGPMRMSTAIEIITPAEIIKR